jgi:hypothetical protein
MAKTTRAVGGKWISHLAGREVAEVNWKRRESNAECNLKIEGSEGHERTKASRKREKERKGIEGEKPTHNILPNPEPSMTATRRTPAERVRPSMLSGRLPGTRR